MPATNYTIRITDAADAQHAVDIDVVLRIDGHLRITRERTPYVVTQSASDLIVMSQAAGDRMLRAELWSDAAGQLELAGSCQVRSVLIIENPHGRAACRSVGGS